MPIEIPDTYIPVADDPELLRASYPLSRLGNVRIKQAKKCNPLCTITILCFCFWPCVFLCFMLYYKQNPRIEVTQNFIPGTLCLKCKTGKIQYCTVIDDECCPTSNDTKDLFICFKCETVYPKFQLEKYSYHDSPWFRRQIK